MIDVSNDFIWYEKYRPRTIDDCIVPERIKNTFQKYVEDKEVPHLLLAGTSGVGKTTIAKAVCAQMGYDVLFINASEERGIDTVRTKIRDFASTVAFESEGKAIILDEADYLNKESTQPALRAFTEEFHSNCRFILTCNHRNKLIEPLQSRFTAIDFMIEKDERKSIGSQFLQRLFYILDQEQVEYDKKAVAALMAKFFPDFRRTINELQKYSTSGPIDEGILSLTRNENYDELFKALKGKKFNAFRDWVGERKHLDVHRLLRGIYDEAPTYLQPKSIPMLIEIVEEKKYRMGFVADPEITLMAALVMICANCEFK